MNDQPWQGDAVSLVEASRKGERHPREELAATLAAIERGEPNAVFHVDTNAAMAADHGTAVVAPEAEELVMGAWSLTGVVGLRQELGDRWPACADQLTGMIRNGLEVAEELVGLDALVMAETRRRELNEAMADMFDQVDILIAATNPSTVFDAKGRLPGVFGGRESPAGNNETMASGRASVSVSQFENWRLGVWP